MDVTQTSHGSLCWAFVPDTEFWERSGAAVGLRLAEVSWAYMEGGPEVPGYSQPSTTLTCTQSVLAKERREH